MVRQERQEQEARARALAEAAALAAAEAASKTRAMAEVADSPTEDRAAEVAAEQVAARERAAAIAVDTTGDLYIPNASGITLVTQSGRTRETINHAPCRCLQQLSWY